MRSETASRSWSALATAAGGPPQPARGLTREERGRDVSAAQAEVEAETSTVQKYLKAMSPRTLWSMAEGYPVVLKQFIQFCLIIIYPAWVFTVLFGAAMHLLFWPMRAYQKKNTPEEYAESQRKK